MLDVPAIVAAIAAIRAAESHDPVEPTSGDSAAKDDGAWNLFNANGGGDQ